MSNERYRNREINALLRGVVKFHCTHLYIITFADSETIEKDGLTISVLSAAQWLISPGSGEPC